MQVKVRECMEAALLQVTARSAHPTVRTDTHKTFLYKQALHQQQPCLR